MSELDEPGRRWPKREDAAAREYLVRATSGIGDIKNLTWRFLVANVAISAFVISHNTEIMGAYCYVLVSMFLLCAISIFIACHSFIKLKDRRIELRELYKGFYFLDVIRPDYKTVGGQYDCGDWAFLVAGVALPLSLFNIIYAVISFHIKIGIYSAEYWWGGYEIWVMVVSVIIILIIFYMTYSCAKNAENKRDDLIQCKNIGKSLDNFRPTSCLQQICPYLQISCSRPSGRERSPSNASDHSTQPVSPSNRGDQAGEG